MEEAKYSPPLSDDWLWNLVANDNEETDIICNDMKDMKADNDHNLQSQEYNKQYKNITTMQQDIQNIMNQHKQSQVWIKKNPFELKFRIEPSPFFYANRIIFAADHSGIYEYNNSNDRCKFIHRFNLSGYSPTQYSYIFKLSLYTFCFLKYTFMRSQQSELNNDILFIGGRNGQCTSNFYDIMMIYNLQTKTMKQIQFGKKVYNPCTHSVFLTIFFFFCMFPDRNQSKNDLSS